MGRGAPVLQVGTLTPQGALVRAQPPTRQEDFFHALDAHLKAHRQRLKELFDEYDVLRRGYLTSRDLMRLLRRLMPEATPADLHYFEVGARLCAAPRRAPSAVHTAAR